MKFSLFRKLIFFFLSVLFFSYSIYFLVGYWYGNYSMLGVASWYGRGDKGEITASGEPYNPNDLTAAHRRLPFGTKVRVENLENNRVVIVRINDRGPYKRGRIIDLSVEAAKKLGVFRKGLAQVKLKILFKPESQR